MKKMSKSIKDYKDAMDSIKISDSFYKRTETLLNELPEAEIEKNPFYTNKKITAGIMAAAACIICVIGVRTLIDVREGNIESVNETGITESLVLETSEAAVPEIIDILEEDDIIDDMLAIDDEIAEYESGTQPVTEGGGAAADPESLPDESEYPAAAPAGGVVTSSNVTDSGRTEADRWEEEPIPDEPDSAAVTKYSADMDNDEATDAGYDTTGHTEAYSEAVGEIPMLSDISFDHVTVEVTPYFDMENIISGENPIKMSGTECREIIEFIAELSESSYEIPNPSFKSIFLLNIRDENIGVTFYSIYVTNQNTMVITKHNTDGQQRVTYGLDQGKYKELKHMLFLLFGTETAYDLFETLVSGK